MDVNRGTYRELAEGEQPTGDEVLIVGTPVQVRSISQAVKAQRRAKSKAARKARRRQR